MNGIPAYVWCVHNRFQWWKNITIDATDYQTHHVERYRGLQGQPRREKVKELIAGLKKQQPVFTSSRDTSATAVKASYLTANDIALASQPYSEGEFVKTCILKAAEIVCSEKLQVFANLSLTRNTVEERIEYFCKFRQPTEEQSQVVCYVFSCAWWKHRHFGRCATSRIYSWRWWDFVCHWISWGWCLWRIPQQPMIFSTLVEVLNRVGVDWSRAVSITTDSAPSMIEKQAGVVTKFKEKVRVVSGGREFWTFHYISHQEALCCKSSKMDHIMQVVVRTVNFI